MGDAASGHRAETCTYVLFAAGSVVVYVLAGLLLPEVYRPFKFFFGINQYKHLGIVGTAAVVVAGLVTVPWAPRLRDRARAALSPLRGMRWAEPCGLGLVALVSAGLFFALRNNFLNADAQDLILKFARDVPLAGAHVTHDEMWELYLHSRFWHHTHAWLGWSVVLSYQVLSSLAGGVFVALLLRYARLLAPARPVALAALVAGGGFMQLFFGDVENYTLTGVLILAYLYASTSFLKGRVSIVWPSGLLSLAMTFHLLAGWLLPSLVYLVLLELRRRKVRQVLLGGVLFVAILASTLVFFHFNGLPIGALFRESHAFGQGGDILSKLAEPSGRYYLGIVNLLLLMVPAAPLAIPLIVFRRIGLDPPNVHLLLASAFMLIYMFTWKATLGVYSDWNLFANVGIPLSLLLWSNVLRIEGVRGLNRVLPAFFWIYTAHSYAWIVANHFSS